jgi:hypothetical protein
MPNFIIFWRWLTIKKLVAPFETTSPVSVNTNPSPLKNNYKNNPIPNINNIPAIIITKGAICLPSIGLSFICYSWGNRVPFGTLLFTPI